MANINDAIDDLGPPQPPPPLVDRRFYLRQDPPPDDPKLVPPQPSPTQQPRPEPYIPSRTDRPYSQWGDPDFALTGARKYPGLSPGPFMPQINDFPALIHAAVMGLGRFGSRYTGMPAIAMGTYATAYWNAYSQGMKERAAQSYQQYRQARQMTIDRGKDEMLAFRQVYAAYHDDKGNVTDPTAFSQALLATAKRFQNHSIINAVENGQIAMAERILQATDGQLNNLIKAQHQEERQKQLDEERRLQIELLKKKLQGDQLPPEWGGSGASLPAEDETAATATPEDSIEPAAIEGGEGDDSGADEGGDQASSGAAEPEAATPPTRLAQAETGTMTDAGRGLGGTPARHIATPEEVNQRIDEYARREMQGEPLPKNIPKQIESRIEAHRGDLERQLDGIVNTGATGDDLMGKIRQFDPALAKTVEDIISGRRIVPSTGGFGSATTAKWNRLTNIAGLVRPGWGPEVASFRREFTNPNSKSQLTLLGATSMTGAARKVLEALQYIGENDKPPSNWIDQIISRNFTGDPQWANLGSALNSYVEESAKLARGGQSAEGDIQRVLKNYAPLGMGPKAVRALLANEAGVAVSKIQSEVDQWQQVTGDKNPPLSFNGKAFQYLEALDNLDMMTGNVKKGYPEDRVPGDLKPLLGPAGSKVEKPQAGAKAGTAAGSGQPYQPGDTKYGYRFKGGDWKDKNNWEKQ